MKQKTKCTIPWAAGFAQGGAARDDGKSRRQLICHRRASGPPRSRSRSPASGTPETAARCAGSSWETFPCSSAHTCPAGGPNRSVGSGKSGRQIFGWPAHDVNVNNSTPTSLSLTVRPVNSLTQSMKHSSESLLYDSRKSENCDGKHDD